MMKALLCEQYGPPEALVLRDVPIPEPGEGEILVEAQFCGLNFPDSLIIQNKYQMKPALPFSPGGELAGLVKQVGPGVEKFRAGDRVAALTNWGAFAEYAVASVAQTTLVPASMDLETGQRLYSRLRHLSTTL